MHQQSRYDLALGAGALLAERDALREAISVWTALIEPASELGRRDVLAAIYSNLAAVYRDLGDFSLARSFQQQSLHWQDDFGADDLLHLANDALAADRSSTVLRLLPHVHGTDAFTVHVLRRRPGRDEPRTT